jgi:hypothetical protein
MVAERCVYAASMCKTTAGLAFFTPHESEE